MCKIVFFDTDILSSFLLTHHELILIKLYSKQMSLARQVYQEMSKVASLKGKLDVLIKNGHIDIIDMDIGSEEERLYMQFIHGTWNPNIQVIGKGEAASIALTIQRKGILASSNFRDVHHYVLYYGLKHLGTMDIIEQAYQLQLLSIEECDHLVEMMIKLKRRLPHPTFSSYLLSKK